MKRKEKNQLDTVLMAHIVEGIFSDDPSNKIRNGFAHMEDVYVLLQPYLKIIRGFYIEEPVENVEIFESGVCYNLGVDIGNILKENNFRHLDNHHYVLYLIAKNVAEYYNYTEDLVAEIHIDDID